MSNFQRSNNPPFLAYPSSPVNTESAKVPMHYSYEGCMPGEPSTSTLIRDQVAPSSRASLPSDLPELYYDHNWPSPHSATSPNMISTPPPEWQTPWQLTDSHCGLNNPSYRHSPSQGLSLSPHQATRPFVAPIDTNCNWKNYQPKVPEHHSMLFASYDDFDPMQQVFPGSSFSSQAANGSNVKDFGLSSPLATNILPSTLSEPSTSYPPTTSQPPLKLHQPRPFRRIPIVSLSNLASACDNFPVLSHTREPNPRNVPVVDLDFGPHSSVSSLAGTAYPSSHRFNKDYFYPTNHVYSSTAASNNRAQVIMCPCGCMESYTFH